MTIWQILEIEPTQDLKQIKSAYAIKLKIYKPECDPDGFQLLREAFERAKQYAAGYEVDICLHPTIASEKTLEATELSEDEGTYAKDINETESSFDVESLVIFLLNELSNNEDDAIKILATMLQNQGPLDNLDFFEEFQKRLAFNLLRVDDRPKFIQFAIQSFHWHEHPEKNSDTFLGICITNLINQTNKAKTISSKKIPQFFVNLLIIVLMNSVFLFYMFYFKKDKIDKVQQNTHTIQAPLSQLNTTVIATNLIKTNNEEILTGANQYRLHLESIKNMHYKSWAIVITTPESKSFSSSHSLLSSISKNVQLNEDGSLDLYIQNASPGKNKEANWLQTPPGNFSIVGQFFWAEDMALKGVWNPPSLAKLN